MAKNFTEIVKSRNNNDGAALITVIAIFAVCSVLAVSITSVILFSVRQGNSMALKNQAYLTAKSVLMATKGHVESILGDKEKIGGLVGKTASGEIKDMGQYTVSIAWSGENKVLITATGIFKGESAELVAVVYIPGGQAA